MEGIQYSKKSFDKFYEYIFLSFKLFDLFVTTTKLNLFKVNLS